MAQWIVRMTDAGLRRVYVPDGGVAGPTDGFSKSDIESLYGDRDKYMPLGIPERTEKPVQKINGGRVLMKGWRNPPLQGPPGVRIVPGGGSDVTRGRRRPSTDSPDDTDTTPTVQPVTTAPGTVFGIPTKWLFVGGLGLAALSVFGGKKS